MIYNETIIRNYFDSINANLIDIISISEIKFIKYNVLCVKMNRINVNNVLVEQELYMNKNVYMSKLISLRVKKLETL